MALISLLGLLLGAYLSLYKFGYIGTLSCSVGSCETVQTSRWSVLLGLPVATWGVGFYALMLALAIVGTQPQHEDSARLSLAILLLSGWGVAFTAWLNYLEGFVIHAWCEFCLGSAALVVVLFVLAVVDYRRCRLVAAEGSFFDGKEAEQKS
jgi:uncharacterized membrane protein